MTLVNENFAIIQHGIERMEWWQLMVLGLLGVLSYSVYQYQSTKVFINSPPATENT